jgi:hypothetical protein
MAYLQEDGEVLKRLTILAIEKTLLDVGKPIHQIVIDKLKKEYNRNLSDCYRHPEYLNSVLKEVFGDSHDAIVGEIRKQLEELAHKEPIRRFIEDLNKNNKNRLAFEVFHIKGSC